MNKRNKEFNDSYKVLSDKAREKAERRYHALCYLKLVVKAVSFSCWTVNTFTATRRANSCPTPSMWMTCSS